VVPFDGDWNGFGFERSFRQRGTGLDLHREGACMHAVRVAPGLAGADVELPAVPRTAQHFALARQPVFPRRGRLQPAEQRATAQRRALVRAAIEQCEELAVDVEDADLAPLYRDDLTGAGRDFVHRCDNVAAHAQSRPYSAAALS